MPYPCRSLRSLVTCQVMPGLVTTTSHANPYRTHPVRQPDSGPSFPARRAIPTPVSPRRRAVAHLALPVPRDAPPHCHPVRQATPDPTTTTIPFTSPLLDTPSHARPMRRTCPIRSDSPRPLSPNQSSRHALPSPYTSTLPVVPCRSMTTIDPGPVQPSTTCLTLTAQPTRHSQPSSCRAVPLRGDNPNHDLASRHDEPGPTITDHATSPPFSQPTPTTATGPTSPPPYDMPTRARPSRQASLTHADALRRHSPLLTAPA